MNRSPTIDRTKVALVFNDMINANLRTPDERRAHIDESGLIPRVVSCVARARLESLPIIWIRVERRPDSKDVIDTRTDKFIASGFKSPVPVVAGTWEAANVDELPVLAEDHVILKPRQDPFTASGLELRLRALGVKTILLGGYSTPMGVESCARTARDLFFDVVVLSDCCLHVERELHQWSLERILPTFARVMPSDDAFELLSRPRRRRR